MNSAASYESPTQLVVKKFQPEPGDAYSRLLSPLQNAAYREVLISLPDGFTVERWTLSAAEKLEVKNRPHVLDVIEEGFAMKPEPGDNVAQEVSMDLPHAVVWHEVHHLHNAGIKGKGQVIAVLDTGITRELAAKLEAEGRFLGAFSTVTGEDEWDEGRESGHGTFCCEAAATFAPEAKIISIKVLSSHEGWGQSSWIIKGYNIAHSRGASIITASLGGPGEPQDAMCRTLDAISRNGILCLSAAGNEQRGSHEYKADASHPACASESATVAAFDSDGELAPFSNWGKCVRLAGLGVRVFQGGRDWNGTSMATPIVAGIAACVRGRMSGLPQFSVEETKKLLYASAIDSSYDAWKEGYGLANGELLADRLGVLPVDDVYFAGVPRVAATKFVAGDDKRQMVITKRRKEIGVFFPKSGA